MKSQKQYCYYPQLQFIYFHTYKYRGKNQFMIHFAVIYGLRTVLCYSVVLFVNKNLILLQDKEGTRVTEKISHE